MTRFLLNVKKIISFSMIHNLLQQMKNSDPPNILKINNYMVDGREFLKLSKILSLLIILMQKILIKEIFKIVIF